MLWTVCTINEIVNELMRGELHTSRIKHDKIASESTKHLREIVVNIRRQAKSVILSIVLNGAWCVS